MVAQRVPDLAGDAVVRFFREIEDLRGTDDVHPAGLLESAESKQRAASRLLDSRIVDDQVQPTLCAGDTHVEHAQTAGNGCAWSPVATRDPACAVFDEIEDQRIELTSLELVRRACLNPWAGARFVQHVLDEFPLRPVGGDDAHLRRDGRPGPDELACGQGTGKHCSNRPPLTGAVGIPPYLGEVISQAVNIDEDDFLVIGWAIGLSYLQHTAVGDLVGKLIDDRTKPVLLVQHHGSGVGLGRFRIADSEHGKTIVAGSPPPWPGWPRKPLPEGTRQQPRPR